MKEKVYQLHPAVEACRICRGSGEDGSGAACEVCGGTGLVRVTREITVRVEPYYNARTASPNPSRGGAYNK